MNYKKIRHFNVNSITDGVLAVLEGGERATQAIMWELAQNGTVAALWQVMDSLAHMEQLGLVICTKRSDNHKWMWRKA